MFATKDFIILLMIGLALASLKGCQCNPDNPAGESEDACLEMHEMLTMEVQPAGVRTVFQLLDCDGYPIVDLKNNELSILLDGEPIHSEGDVAPVLTQEVDFESYSLLLLDMSDSIVASGSLEPMVGAARDLVHKLVSQGQKVAIYRFAGPKYFAGSQNFTADESLLDGALETLSNSDGLGTTDLYGSISRAIDVLDGAGSNEILTTRTLVLFTDGSDEAMAATSKSAKSAIDNSDIQVFTIGLGGDVDQDELHSFGKSGFEWAEDSDKLDEAFNAITQSMRDLARSYYLVGVCSPRVSGWREMTLEIDRDGETGSLVVHYDATNFDIVGCDVNAVAFPCKDKQCGEVDGLSCGTCQGSTYCTDAFVCQEACQGNVECGFVMGVDCGDCQALGDSFACDDTICVDACAEAECGFVMGIDCGDCQALGDNFACDQNHACVDACQDAECGTIMGADCGDCSDQGERFGCDQDHTCKEACASAECGTVLGVNCGDCSKKGDSFGCDQDHTCVDACAEAECGTVFGIDCGKCEEGEACNDAHLCAPVSIAGISWSRVNGGDITLGCNMVLDPACGLDETRQEVTLSDYWIMDTEVTVAMFQTCVDEGGCNSSYVQTGGECNFGEEGRQDHPINCITYEGLKQFCSFVGGGLPTEAQWERAYRGDHDDEIDPYWIYPWGNSPAPSCERVVMSEEGPGCGLGHPDEVSTKPVTSFALRNMAGNVSEWTADYYAETLAGCSDSPCVDPTGPSDGSDRVVRGGAFDDFYLSAFRTAKRDKNEPSTRSPSVGGRCAR